MQEITDIFTTSSEEAGVRLDKLLTNRFPQHSRTYFQYLIDQGCVLVNGAIYKKREKPKADDEIEVCFQLTPELSLEPQDIPLNILYEDPYLVAIDKPAGMVVHPAPGHPSGTFVNALLHHCKELQGSDSLRPGIVHRLDKDTSGVLLAAKTQEAHQKLVQAFSERKIDKTYLAVAVGKAQEGLIDAPIKRHPVNRKEMAVCPEGKEAKSLCRILGYNEALSFVEIKLITGRTHQIRVHLKHKGTPVLGDPVYGSLSANKKYQVERQLLHAYQIKFNHPITNAPLEICAPIPKDLRSFAESFPNTNF
ncbi:MAG: RluA family pseudouridine synthase [Verrucomicrobia bacterium]|nr:RluA family pseudouridine synthase [Verrucomicrobiota bacterium]